MNEKIIIGGTFALYLVVMLCIGLHFYHRTNNLSDYTLGGRKLGYWGSSISAQASDMSGWLLLGLPGAAFLTGLSGSVWMALGLAIGTYLNWKIVAKRLRVDTQKYSDSITVPSYLENRFNDKSRTLKLISSLFILVFFIPYTASGFVSGGKLFTTVFGTPYIISVIICGIVVVSYTFLGGFMAVCYTDIIQGLLMFFTLLVLPIIVIVEAGGLGNILSTFDPSLLNPLDIGFITGSSSGTVGMAVIGIISSLAWGLGYFGQPHIITKFMAIENPEEIKISRRIATVWVIITLLASTAIGLVGHYYFPNLTGADSETIFILLVHKCVPLIFIGVLLSSILAAIMSTADSQLLVISSTISEDIYRSIIKPKASDKELIGISRLSVLVVALIAFCISLNPDSSVLKLVSYAWAGFGCAFGPVILLSLFWEKMTRNGAVAGMLIGGFTSATWPIFKNYFSAPIFNLYEIVPGFLLALIAIYVVSNLDMRNHKVK
ncbi:proline:sodium symporter PutP [Clostridium botulinum]|uniref:sodium/proline symporter PutP n=1 Tax=Clostridium botulinum TaxID=1491 RepID=UPI00059795CE|nr:sodium/proline symporter PutP [Clostridium botulinum]KIL07948.1 proline:sodium symporter PutP [Clostridium botulinum]MBY6933714.1 sodium/proline symporter PutP [Clostridium botulinum]NFL84231.1 sodium/proline symporter PutP [Clostridium botulinum]NFN10375.1 sodium/proline symporter PutP [Clostridium botulinum]NFO35541.1 sodium/proline symporter PutP [Clostridium botulinum]